MARTKSLSRFLNTRRNERGLSVAEIANRVGVSAMSVYNWEAGRSRPRTRNLTALCKALKVKVADVEQMTAH